MKAEYPAKNNNNAVIKMFNLTGFKKKPAFFEKLSIHFSLLVLYPTIDCYTRNAEKASTKSSKSDRTSDAQY